jgi:hypothetical protein
MAEHWPDERARSARDPGLPSGASGFTGETDKGGPIDNGGIVTPTGNTAPTRPFRQRHDSVTDAVRAHGATDAEGDPI